MGGHNHDQQKDSSRRRWSSSCELCEQRATVFCPSDEAKLCDLCDVKVHSANFLVARHSRHVLCTCCGEPALHSPLTGPRIDTYRLQEPCAQCAPHTKACHQDVDVDVDVEALSSTESCCIDADEDRISSASPTSTPRTPKRPTRSQPASADMTVLWQEEGLGDSEDGRYGSPSPFLQSLHSSKRRRCLR